MNNLIDNLKYCIDLQNRMNVTVNPQWVSAGYRWDRAAMLEAAELFDHIGWKWWKHQEINKQQCLLELVDIFHFIISYDIIYNEADAVRYSNIYVHANKHIRRNQNKEYAFDLITKFIETASTYNECSVRSFFEIVVALDFTIEDIVKWYIGKNVLNQFRQAYGYKTGTYIKNWATKDEKANGSEYEDNEVLAQILTRNPSITAEQLHDELTSYYTSVVM